MVHLSCFIISIPFSIVQFTTTRSEHHHWMYCKSINLIFVFYNTKITQKFSTFHPYIQNYHNSLLCTKQQVNLNLFYTFHTWFEVTHTSFGPLSDSYTIRSIAWFIHNSVHRVIHSWFVHNPFSRSRQFWSTTAHLMEQTTHFILRSWRIIFIQLSQLTLCFQHNKNFATATLKK